MAQTLGLERSAEASGAPSSRSNLYERDFFLWTQKQARLLRQVSSTELDIENLVDEVQTLGRSVKHEIESRLNVLILHLLKWRYQPTSRSSGWKGTILEQRSRLRRRIAENPSLLTYPSEAVAEEYETARLLAAGETKLPEESFPLQCPFSIEKILDPTFFPEAE